jgi:hypothetical protein
MTVTQLKTLLTSSQPTSSVIIPTIILFIFIPYHKCFKTHLHPVKTALNSLLKLSCISSRLKLTQATMTHLYEEGAVCAML